VGVVDRRSLDSVARLSARRVASAGPAVDRVSAEDNPSGAPLEGQWPAKWTLDFVGEQAGDQPTIRIIVIRPALLGLSLADAGRVDGGW